MLIEWQRKKTSLSYRSHSTPPARRKAWVPECLINSICVDHVVLTNGMFRGEVRAGIQVKPRTPEYDNTMTLLVNTRFSDANEGSVSVQLCTTSMIISNIMFYRRFLSVLIPNHPSLTSTRSPITQRWLSQWRCCPAGSDGGPRRRTWRCLWRSWRRKLRASPEPPILWTKHGLGAHPGGDQLQSFW